MPPFTPLRDRVLILVDPPATESNGIAIPDSAGQRLMFATVVAVGSGRVGTHNGAIGYIWLDNSQIDTGNAGNNGSISGVCVGANADGGFETNARVAELIVYPRALDSGELTQLWQYYQSAYIGLAPPNLNPVRRRLPHLVR